MLVEQRLPLYSLGGALKNQPITEAVEFCTHKAVPVTIYYCISSRYLFSG